LGEKNGHLDSGSLIGPILDESKEIHKETQFIIIVESKRQNEQKKKQFVTCKGTTVLQLVTLSARLLHATMEWDDRFKVLKNDANQQ
jgi:hypothetical protein